LRAKNPPGCPDQARSLVVPDEHRGGRSVRYWCVSTLNKRGHNHETQRPRSTTGLVVAGATASLIRLDIGGAVVTASITNEAVDELKPAAGQDAYAAIKASVTMVAVD
jgi:molybdopterin-binding protein